MKLRVCALSLAAFLLMGLSSVPARAAEGGFVPVRTYGEPFADVAADAWYYDSVRTLYELGLINGKADRFAPEDDMSVAEVLTLAARLRSLYETGDSEAGHAGGDGGAWYLPYVAYLQSLEVIGQEFAERYERPATRAEMAHVLANILPRERFEPRNREIVAAGRASGQFMRDVGPLTPYEPDIVLLYDWGILGGADETGAFLPDQPISRCEVAVMAARLIDGGLRLTLDWEIVPAYSRRGVTMPDLVTSDGTFYAAPDPGSREQIDADVRYMLSRGEREIALKYPADVLTNQMVDQILSAFLEGIRQYTEQTYNYISISVSARTGFFLMSFSSSFYSGELAERYREETMACAIAVHDAMWEAGRITEDMSEYEKAKVYFTWICENCRYDHTYADMSHTGYRLFREGIAVCDGYTAAYNLLLKLEGISCGTYALESQNHIWTVAELDGTTYHIDATWGDQTGQIAYRFFGMTEAESLARFSQD